MNSLLEPALVEALYAASQAGVEIDLIVRGICSLRPGVKGLSENIRVRSIVGRFLEHSRIFYFLNGGKDEVYCGSADWMPRNLFERCEVVFPVQDPQIGARIRREILAALLSDRAKARVLNASGVYHRISPGTRRPAFNAQDFFMQAAEGKASPEDIPAEKPHRPVKTSGKTHAARKRPAKIRLTAEAAKSSYPLFS
jgi:polyphosphate kinase